MATSRRRLAIPTQLGLALFEQFVLPHLSSGSRGPIPKLSLLKIFNYILQLLYLGCQWKELPIDKDGEGRPEIHYTRIYRAFRRWEADGCMDAIFASSVLKLHADGRLDITVIHGDGTTTAAKKGGDNIGFNGHKKIKGDKVVAFCDRNCNVIAPFVSAPGNRNESPLLREALPEVMRIARAVGMDLQLVAGFSELPNLLEKRHKAGSLASVPGSGKSRFSGGQEWLQAADDWRFRHNWVSHCSNNLSCHTCPAAAADRYQSSVC